MARHALVTGADGFLGRNLCAALSEIPDLAILKFDIANRPQDLDEYTRIADFVFHLAAVMRPPAQSEFEKVNVSLTERVLSLLKGCGRRVPVLLTSSIQAELDNPYGASKRAAEQAVLRYGRESGADVYVYRLPNVFGKWCRPNYSSAVATWCYNIAHDLPIYVRDPSADITLAYVEDVVSDFLVAMERGKRPLENGFCDVPVKYPRTLGQVSDVLCGFKERLDRKEEPEARDAFERALLETFMSYWRERGESSVQS